MENKVFNPGDLIRYSKAMVTHLGWEPERMNGLARVLVVHRGYVAAQWTDGSITHLSNWQITKAA